MHLLEDDRHVVVLLAAGVNQVFRLLEQLEGKLNRRVFSPPGGGGRDLVGPPPHLAGQGRDLPEKRSQSQEFFLHGRGETEERGFFRFQPAPEFAHPIGRQSGTWAQAFRPCRLPALDGEIL